MSVIQLALFAGVPDNELHEPTVKRASVPVAKLIDGRWCWRQFGSDAYMHEPALEQILLAALAKQHIKKAA